MRHDGPLAIGHTSFRWPRAATALVPVATVLAFVQCGGAAVAPAPDASPPPVDQGLDAQVAPVLPVPRFRLLEGCSQGNGDVELSWEPVEGATGYELAWSGGTTSLLETRARVVGAHGEFTLRALRPERDVEQRFTTQGMSRNGGDTLILRGRREGRTTWEVVSCVRARVATGSDSILPQNATPAYVGGDDPDRLEGTVALLGPGERGNGALLFADRGALTVHDFGSPFVQFSKPLDVDFAVPSALAVDEVASYVARPDGTIRILPQVAGTAATLSSVELVHRRIVRIAREADGLWVLAAHDGTESGLASRLFYFPTLVADASPTVVAELPDDTPAPDYRFDPHALVISNLAGTADVYVGSRTGTTITWTRNAGPIAGLRSITSSAEYTFVVAGATGSDVLTFPRAQLATPPVRFTIPDARELEIGGYVEPYDRPIPP